MNDQQIPRPARAPREFYSRRELTGEHSGTRVTVWEIPVQEVTQQDWDEVAAAGPVLLGLSWREAFGDG